MQESVKDIAQKLKQFRPSATVLEAEVAPARRGEGAGGLAGPGLTASTAPSDFQEVMRIKRKWHDGTIQVRLRNLLSGARWVDVKRDFGNVIDGSVEMLGDVRGWMVQSQASSCFIK